MKKSIATLLFLFISLFSIGFLHTPLAHASFNANNLIDDSIFNSKDTMDATAIDNWLNINFGSASCISTSHGFSAPDVIGYSPTGPSDTGGFYYGSDVSAGTIIYHAAQVYGLNPQVILTTLEKEESLVTGSGTQSNPGCSNLRYTAAMGYLCTDTVTPHNYSGWELYSLNGVPVTSVTGTCTESASVAGFSRQVIVAAWQMKFDQNRSEGNVGWNVQRSNYPNAGNNWDNSDDPQTCYSHKMTQGYYQTCPNGPYATFDGLYSIDGTTVHMDNGPTAALYNYTPHFPGNQNFDSIFQNWFGSTTGPGYSFIDSTGPQSQILPNDVVNVVVHLKNMSGITWYSDGNVPTGQHPTRLAMLNYQNSPFANPADPAWLGTQNQIRMVESSVADGGTATFQATLKGPLQQVGTYAMKFAPVLDGVRFYQNIGMEWDTSTPAPNYSYQVISSSGFTGNLPTSYTDAVTLTIKNTGNVVWFNEGSRPVGAAPLRMLTAKPFYHPSNFFDSGTWLANNQVSMSSSKVTPNYNAVFSFNLKTPATNGTYNESFGLVLDGVAVFSDTSQMNYSINVADYSFSVVSTDIPTSLIAGQKYTSKVILKNTGFATWYSDGNTPQNVHPIRLMMAGYQNNPLADLSDTSWMGPSNQIKMLSASVAPGANGEFDFNFVAPYNSSGAVTDLRLVLDGVWILPSGVVKINTSIPAKQFSYDAVNGTVNPPPTITKGQIVPLKLMLKNNTNFVWYNDDSKPSQFRGGSIRLVMTNPWYRSSVFTDSADPAWLGTTNQIKMVTPTVNPGQTGEFDFNWRAPNTTGFYRERFAPVLDGYSIFPDIGMEFDTTVQ